MRVILEWMCQNLLFDSFEFVFWMTIIEQDNFDILIVRDKTMLQSNLPLQLFYLYIGLHLKVYLNYQQPTFKPKS